MSLESAVWVRLASWMIADREPSEPAAGDVLRRLGVRALCSSMVRAGSRDCIEPTEGPEAHWQLYDLTGPVEQRVDFEVKRNPSPIARISQFLVRAGPITVLAQIDSDVVSHRLAERMTFRGCLAAIGTYEWDEDGFDQADVRTDWLVHRTIRIGPPIDPDVMLLLEPLAG